MGSSASEQMFPLRVPSGGRPFLTARASGHRTGSSKTLECISFSNYKIAASPQRVFFLPGEGGYYGSTEMADQDAIQSKRWVNIWRSERVFLRVPILVRGQAENDSSLFEESHTLVVKRCTDCSGNEGATWTGVAAEEQSLRRRPRMPSHLRGRSTCLGRTRLPSRLRNPRPTFGISTSRPLIGNGCWTKEGSAPAQLTDPSFQDRQVVRLDPGEGNSHSHVWLGMNHGAESLEGCIGVCQL